MEFEKELSVSTTNIPGLLLIDLPVHGDNRGWFKENWQREKLVSLGVPDIKIVQNNISFNSDKGTTRGIHAEPWDKYISLASGSIFGAWVDLREGDTFGEVFTCELDPSKAIFVPRGVGNSFQALEDNTAYTYLVNAHWSIEKKQYYTFVNLADPQLDISWPIPLGEVQLSEADKNHPFLSEVEPLQSKRMLVIGAKGQLGRALNDLLASNGKQNVDYVDIEEFDITNQEEYESIDWDLYDTVINVCAYTAVDLAETDEGRIAAWKANAIGPSLLAKVAIEHDLTIVHISTDYVFDGREKHHTTDEAFSPLSVYGQSKAAGDLAISIIPKHYIIRTSWVIGDGNNFVRTMSKLSDRCADPSDDLTVVAVVNDQIGRLAFSDDLAKYIYFLIEDKMPYGTYNFTNPGEIVSWFDIACKVFDMQNDNSECVEPTTTSEYCIQKDFPVANRPFNSALQIDEPVIEGLSIKPWAEKLLSYLSED